MAAAKTKRRAAAPPPAPTTAAAVAAADADGWRLAAPLLAAAFVARALVALSGDFVIHPDEIMQYLEPAHRAVFGNGVAYWEYIYGARSWLVPGVVAGILWLCALLGLDWPGFYIPFVKLFFCAFSLLVPWAMYRFARLHYGHLAGRVALVFGCFWYELAAFAHKPMTEYLATPLVLLLMAMAFRPGGARDLKAAAAFGLLAAAAIAVRFQYAPVVAAIGVYALIRAPHHTARASIVGFGALGLLAVGLLDKLTWGGWFHSYYTNYMMNVIVGAGRAGESSAWRFLLWPTLAGFGLPLVAGVMAAVRFRRHWPAAGLILILLITHAMQEHREYRFIFLAAPLWLLIFAAEVARFLAAGKKHVRRRQVGAGLCAAAFVVSVAGIFNLLPLQRFIYEGFSRETGIVGFLRGHDPLFKIHRQLAARDDVKGVWQYGRQYFNTGGYYMLHHRVPFYDQAAGLSHFAPFIAEQYVSHILAPVMPEGARRVATDEAGRSALVVDEKFAFGLPVLGEAEDGRLMFYTARGNFPLSAFEKEEGASGAEEWQVWRRKDNSGEVKAWRDYRVYIDGMEAVMRRIFKDPPSSPPRFGIEVIEEKESGG